ncbi:hypothetical protein JYQ62_05290 [Nostoc sp. UHCC 0702]|nr:hypothetical protein JYQ62_05290 [Nostoc sp. UHCC 0702]
MKKPFFPVTKLLVATVAGISVTSLLIAKPSLAQVNQTDTFPSDSTTDQNTDPFSRANSDNFSMFDLIHRAKFGNLNWNSDEQNQQLDSAAAAFKARQQRLLQGEQQQGQVVPGSPTITSPVITPGSATP